MRGRHGADIIIVIIAAGSSIAGRFSGTMAAYDTNKASI